MNIWWIKYVVITSSVILLAAGIAAFFAPDGVAILLNNAQAPELFIQLYGSALIGFGFANWHIRHAPVGGIYGRAIVTGNIIHFLSGTGLLLGFILGESTATGVSVLFAVYLLLSIGYVAILFSGGIEKGSSEI